MNGLKDLIVVAPMVLLLLSSLIPLFIKVFNGNKEPARFITLAYSGLGILAALFLIFSLHGAKHAAFSDAIVMDGFSVWASALILMSGLFALALMFDHIETQANLFAEKCFLLCGSMMGALVLVMANDLIVTFLGIESMSLCLYILIAMSREATLSKEAAFKYFVLGSFASAIFLYGIALIYGSVGTTQLPALVAKSAELLQLKNHLFYIGICLIILGFSFKVSVFPFHAWTPDVYQGAPTPLTAFMATAVKAASFVALLRVTKGSGLATEPHLAGIVSWMAGLTMIVGNTGAIMQTNLKRMLAYSSVAHSGYLMIGFIAGAFGDNYDSAATVILFYLVSYSIMTFGSFALIAIMEKAVGASITLEDLRGLGRRHPLWAACMTLVLFSLAGVPPMLGFFAKFSLFGAAMEQDLYWLAFWGVLNSVISVYYYLRPIVMMYMTEPETEIELNTGALSRATLLTMALLTLVIGVVSSPLFDFVRASVLNRF